MMMAAIGNVHSVLLDFAEEPAWIHSLYRLLCVIIELRFGFFVCFFLVAECAMSIYSSF